MTSKNSFYRNYGKRLFDIIASLLAIVVFWWVFVILFILVYRKIGSPVIFVQERPGRNEKVFKLYKFRTMTNACDEQGNLLPDMARLTTFGKFLRNSSLDELPEIWNILKGDMSIIGPRPLLVKYLPLYNEVQKRRHEVRPGMSGLAQVYGRNAVTWEKKFEMDVWYVDHITFWGDIKLILDTLLTVARHENIDSKEAAHVTMEEFKGTIGDKK